MMNIKLFLFSIFAAITFLLSNTVSGLVGPHHTPARSTSQRSQPTRSLFRQKVSFLGATAILPEVAIEKRTKDRQEQEQKSITDDLWELRVYNDNINTLEWVAKCLVLVTALTEWKAYQTTKVAHQEGEACLGLYEKEVAELYSEGLQQEGIVVKMFPVGDFQ